MKSKTLITGLTPPLEGGSERHIYEISARIPQTTVLTQKGTNCNNSIQLPIIRFAGNFVRNISFSLIASIYLVLLFLSPKKKFDTIHINENLMYPLVTLLSIRYKTVITVHGLTGFAFYENKLIWFLFRKGLQSAHKVIVVSPNEGDILKKEEIASTLIPNGVDTEIYKKIPSQNIGKRITFVGRIHEQKGIDTLIKAFYLISPNFPKYQLQIIGKAEGKYYRALKARYSSKSIIWKGFIGDRTELFTHLSSAELLVFPSRWEALPWPALLEGLASGRPVIASNLPGMNQIFRNGKDALLVKPDNVEILAEAITKLLTDKSKASKIGVNGKKKAQEFSWNSTAAKLQNVYKSLSF